MKGSAVITCLYLICSAFGRAPDSQGKITYAGNQLWKITNDNQTLSKLLNVLEEKEYLTVWGRGPATIDAMINAKHVDEVKKKLKENNLQYEVSLEDVQKAIDEENLKPDGDLISRRGHPLTWVHYHRLDDIYAYLSYLAATFPTICSLHIIGHSVEGRPIKLLKISHRSSTNKAIFIEGGIHAREWISPAAVTYIIEHFIYDHDDEPDFIKNIDWYIVPVLNPDGYEYTHTNDRLWRKNRAKLDKCSGVDLNRNWGYLWDRNGSSIDPCSNLYRGPKPFSEPETATIANFFSINKNINWSGFLSVHSYGQYIVYPWGTRDGTVLEDHDEINKIAAEAASAIASASGLSYIVGPAGTTIYGATGNSMDWARGVLSIKYTYTIELRDRGHYGFLLPAGLIQATSDEALTFCLTIVCLLVIGRTVARAPPLDPAEGTAEDEAQGRILYTGSQLWKTVIDKKAQIQVLAQLRDEHDISMWGGNATSMDVLVKPDSVDKVKERLTKNGIRYEVVIEDLQKAIDEENPSEIELDDRQGHRMTWQAYHRYADIQGYLDYLATTYPDLCSVQTIGYSIQNKPIKLLKISNGNPGNKAVWIDGGIHAREWISPATVTFIINQFVSNFESEPASVQNIDWYIAPVLNPDGYEYSHTRDRLWRKNLGRSGQCPGTDLNRNFGYRWGGRGSSKNPCTETYGGTGPFSEPETAAVKNFIQGNSGANWKAYVSFHSYGQYVLYPWGYDRVVPPDYKDLESVGRKIASAIRSVGGPSYTVGPAANTLYPASGGSDDWAKGVAKFKYAYTIELRDNGRYGFVLPAAYIQPTGKEALAAVRVIAEAAAAA
ncbi:carboxypeptidase B-like [Asbolus verrucosus]|uniref:Carboxypeptidase B-like n=1 Tax=Asbolus verrucosus TaxID=1661398 RepID=A0A482VX31_ASBVE|nr:carboxypeptidase B-like [Asbolus verrucosus]